MSVRLDLQLLSRAWSTRPLC